MSISSEIAEIELKVQKVIEKKGESPFTKALQERIILLKRLIAI